MLSKQVQWLCPLFNCASFVSVFCFPHTPNFMNKTVFLKRNYYLNTKSAACTKNLASAPLSGGVARK